MPPVYETRTVVVAAGHTVPAVTTRQWVQTSPAVAGRAAQGHWVTVVVTPARTETRTTATQRWVTGSPGTGTPSQPPPMPGMRGAWVTIYSVIEVTIPAVTEPRWVVTSPAVAARDAQGHWTTVVTSPARWVPPVTTTERVQISPAVQAQGRFVTTPGAVTVIGQLLVSAERAAVYEERTVIVTPGRTEIIRIPVVTAMERVQISPGAPAQFRITETVVTPGRWTSVWVPPVTTTQTVRVAAAIPPVYVAVEETIPGRYERIWIPAVTELRLVEVVAATAGQLAQGHWEAVASDRTRWVETAPAVAAQGEWRDVVVSAAVTVPAVTTTETVWSTSGHWESLSGTITVERDREYIFTSRWRAPGRQNDMGITINYVLNRTVVGVQAVHVLHRYQNMGHLFVRPVSQTAVPGRIELGFNYPHPGQVTSTLFVVLHFAGGETFEFEMQIPVNGIVVSQRVGLEQESFNRSAARAGTITIP